jgi:hypothetical protein
MLTEDKIIKEIVRNYVILRENKKFCSWIKYTPQGDLRYKLRNKLEEKERQPKKLYLRMIIDPIQTRVEEIYIELICPGMKESNTDECKIYDKYKFLFNRDKKILYLEKHEKIRKPIYKAIKKKENISIHKKMSLIERIKSKLKLTSETKRPEEQYKTIKKLEFKESMREKTLYSRSWESFVDWNNVFKLPTYLDGFKNIIGNVQLPSEVKNYFHGALEFAKEDMPQITQICKELTYKLLDI